MKKYSVTAGIDEGDEKKHVRVEYVWADGMWTALEMARNLVHDSNKHAIWVAVTEQQEAPFATIN